MTFKLLLNGRFLNRPVTGVERLALELSRGLRKLLAATGERDVDIAVSSATDVEACIAALDMPVPTILTVGRWKGHAWEQVDLPRMAFEPMQYRPNNTAAASASNL